jgi:hypothetical protein
MDKRAKLILLRCHDDSVMVMTMFLKDGYGTLNRKGTKEEIEMTIKKASEMYPPERLPIIGWEEIEDENIVSDRTFRNAWITKGGKKIDHDMNKAREIHREKLRAARVPILEKLDVDYIIADENNNSDEKNRIVKDKQRLRDITKDPRIDAANNIEALKIIGING